MPLQAAKASIWSNRYEISVDDRLVATWKNSAWRTGGTLELEGQRYSVRANLWGSTYGMAREDGTAVATADHVGRKRWSVQSGGRTYELQRASMWRQEQELRSGDERVGWVRRTSMWRSGASAELPGLPLPVQVFVLVVVISMWDRANSSAAAGAGAAGGAAAASG